jgi:chemotaxis protein CheX
MDVKLINPFITATLDVLSTMASIECKPGKAYVKQNNIAKGDVTGIIGLTGTINGTIAVTFDEKSILQVVSTMFGEELTELDEEIIDAVGELTNMISGQAINDLVQIGINFDIAVPSVIYGKNHIVKHITKGPKIAVPFATDIGSFTIEISFDS